MHKSLPSVAAIALVTLALSACSASSLLGQRETVDQPEAFSSSAAPTADELEQIREYWPLTDDTRVPLFVGMNLDDAVDLADSLRLRLDNEDARGDRSIWNRSNWTVVRQDLPPGRPISDNSFLTLRVLKNDEVTTEVQEALAFDLHTDERMFTGTITAYEQDGSVGISTVFVDAKPVRLDMIVPLAPGCGAALKEGLEEARRELENQLPLGQRVLVVMSEQHSDSGFLHTLPNDSNEPAVKPPADSVNERLVRTGWWVPDSLSFEGGIGLTGYGQEATALEPYSPRASVISQAVNYVPYIAQAGDEAVNQYIGTIGDCRRAAEADREAYVIAWEQSEEERRQRVAELERRIAAGYYSCRDGDGDGVCYER